MKNPICSLLCVVGCLLAADGVEGALIYGHHNDFGPTADRGSLYLIDTVTQSVTLVGSDLATRPNSGPEIQFDAAGTTIFFSQPAASIPSNGDTLLLIDPTTGLGTGSLALSGMPLDGAGEQTRGVTAMETVGATLYASFHRGGEPGRSGILGIINTTTGAVTPTGEMTGSSRPTGGMHFVGGTMYAVSSTGNIDGQLLTVDLNTGAQTLVGNLTLGGVPQQGATALAYADGKMYTVFNQDSNLYSIDLATSALTSEFDMGVELNSLTVIPEPSGFLLLALGAVVADMAYRRRSV